ncbi:tetratricopeptide repeat protein [Streptomyces sp. NPDC055243]|uniref:tetratricopeptide repeat protein n=1 Tax=Streptomyces sp. NPDC055243 TaxID=3365720 RepID=UPI0037D44DE6
MHNGQVPAPKEAGAISPVRPKARLEPLKDGLAPEKRALAEDLRRIFLALKISVRRYAERQYLSPSTVTRYLNGERIPPWNFVAGVITEAQEYRAPLTAGAEDTLRELHREAIEANRHSDVQRLQARVVEADENTLRIASQQQALRKALRDREGRLTSLRSRCRSLETQFEEQRLAHRAEVQFQRSEYQRLQEECSDLQDQVAYLQEALSLTRTELIAAEDRCHRLETRLETVQGLYADEREADEVHSLMTRLVELADHGSSVPELVRAVGKLERRAWQAVESGLPSSADQSHCIEGGTGLRAALAIYREIGDTQGQVRTLFRLGTQAAKQADTKRAIDHFGTCARLAAQLGDYERGARALAHLASCHGGIGQLDEAHMYFADARDMANHLKNPIVAAQTLQRNADFLWTQGRIGEAITHLTDAVRLLEDTGEGRDLARTRVALGEALVVAGRWRYGLQILQSVLAETDHSSPALRAQATRALAISHSRRGLHREAESTIILALDQCERSAHESGIMQCRLTLANVYARDQEWSKALDQYSKATKLAVEQKALHALLVARAMAAVCRLRGEERDRAGDEIVNLIPLIEQFGMHSVKAALRLNLGSHHARFGDHEKALTEFRKARTVIEQLADDTLRAPCFLNMARSYRALGDIERSRTHALEAFAVHHELGDWPLAGEALVLLGGLYVDVGSGNSFEPALEDLVGSEQQVDERALEAIARSRPTRNRSVKEAGTKVSYPLTVASAGRKINISDSVRRALTGIGIDPLLRYLGSARRTCEVCQLLIDEAGKAELLLMKHQAMDRLMLRLSHPHCMVSQVVQLEGWAPTEPEVVLEVECILFGGDRAGIIVDCLGGWGIHEDARVEDLVLTTYRKAGFTDLQMMLQTENHERVDLRDIPGVTSGSVRAHLQDTNLSISSPDGQLLCRMPLNFYPSWYRSAAQGSLIVVVGRNLQGMAADDPSYLLRAMVTGNTVGGSVPLTVAA